MNYGCFAFYNCPLKTLEEEFEADFTSSEFKKKLEEKFGFDFWVRQREVIDKDYAGKASSSYRKCHCTTHFPDFLCFSSKDECGVIKDKERFQCCCTIDVSFINKNTTDLIKTIENAFGKIILEKHNLPELTKA